MKNVMKKTEQFLRNVPGFDSLISNDDDVSKPWDFLVWNNQTNPILKVLSPIVAIAVVPLTHKRLDKWSVYEFAYRLRQAGIGTGILVVEDSPIPISFLQAAAEEYSKQGTKVLIFQYAEINLDYEIEELNTDKEWFWTLLKKKIIALHNPPVSKRRK